LQSYYFTQKINCIYKNIANGNIDALVGLFILDSKKDSDTYFQNRKTHILRNWLQSSKDNFVPRFFKNEFEHYPFYSKITIDNRPLFKDANEFLNMTLEAFCDKIYRYKTLEKELSKFDLNYKFKYFYIFNETTGKKENFSINEYKIEYKNKISLNRFEIDVINSNNPTIAEYYGEAIFEDNKLILHFKNDWNYVTIIANLELLSKNSRYLVGIASGFSYYNNKIAGAKKVILTKQRDSNFKEQFLTLNKTEYIYAEENSYKHNLSNYNDLKNHFNKYVTKLNNLNRFFKDLAINDIYSSTYYQLAFNEFNMTSKIFSHVNSGKSFYIKDRYSILKTVLSAQPYEKYKKLYISMSVLDKYFLFNYFSKESNRLIELFTKVNKSKVDIELIFIIDDCQKEFKLEFKEHLKNLSKVANVKFFPKYLIEDSVDSLDFIYTDNKDYVIFKPIRTIKQVFIYTNNEVTINQFEAIFNRLKFRAIDYPEKQEEVEKISVSNYCQNEESKNILDGWYLYYQGSKNFWEFKIKILAQKVNFLYKDDLRSIGTIINKKEQSIIIAEDLKTGIISTYVFDNNLSNLKYAFLVKIVTKKYNTNEDIFTIGICSKEKIDINDAKKILNSSNSLISIDSNIQNKLANYIFKKYE